MKSIDPKLLLLVAVVIFFLIALFYCEHMFPHDGVLFQTVNNVFVGFSAILANDLRKEFGQSDDTPPGTTSRETTQVTVQGPNPQETAG